MLLVLVETFFLSPAANVWRKGRKMWEKLKNVLPERVHVCSIRDIESRASFKAIYTVSDEEGKGGVRQVKNFSRLYTSLAVVEKRGECVLLL